LHLCWSQASRACCPREPPLPHAIMPPAHTSLSEQPTLPASLVCQSPCPDIHSIRLSFQPRMLPLAVLACLVKPAFMYHPAPMLPSGRQADYASCTLLCTPDTPHAAGRAGPAHFAIDQRYLEPVNKETVRPQLGYQRTLSNRMELAKPMWLVHVASQPGSCVWRRCLLAAWLHQTPAAVPLLLSLTLSMPT